MAGGGPPQGSNNGDDRMFVSFVNTDLVGVAISLPIIATITTIIRFHARRVKGDGRSRMDDWTLLLTLVLCWGHSINTLVAGGIGGINRITIPPREYANVALRTLWISSFFLITALYTVKISILLFYYRIFSIKHSFRRAVIGMIIILTLWWVSALTLVLLSTDPIQSAWKDAARAHHRFDFNTWYVSYSGLSILFDVVILCFPIPMVRKLRVNTKQKISILGIFWLGGFVCISAIIRFIFLYNTIYKLKDYGKNDYSTITVAFIWAEIEPNTSVIAACLPTYGPLFKEGRFLPKFLRSLRSVLQIPTKNATTATYGSGKDSISKPSEYYELNHIGSKDNGDLFSVTDTKQSILSSKEIHDVESQREIDRDRIGRLGQAKLS